MSGDFIHCWNCSRCDSHIHIVEPVWHYRALFNPYTRRDVYTKIPDRFIIKDPDYSDQLDLINKTNSIEVLAEIHATTTDELKKIGYN
jgi:hypothetical protein